MSQPTINVILDRRRESTKGDNKGKFHIKIQMTFKQREGTEWQRVRRVYKTGLYANVDEFRKIRNNPRNEDLKKIAGKLFDMVQRARKIVEESRFISPDIFEREFTDVGGYDNVVDSFDHAIKENQEAGNIGNALAYTNAKNSFIYFAACQDKRIKPLFDRLQQIAEDRKKWKRTNAKGQAKILELRDERAATEKAIRANRTISFFEVTPDWLFKYEQWMGDKVTACAMNLRCMRARWNAEISNKKVPADLYPFARSRHDKSKYTIPEAAGTKFALSEDQLNDVIRYHSGDPGRIMARDFWYLTYLLYGLNMADIAALRFKNIRNDVIYIERQKTKNTNRIKKVLEIPIDPTAQVIINKYSNRTLHPDDFVFPILSQGLTAAQAKKCVQNFLKKKVNGPLKKVGSELNFKFSLTTYIARHTFATLSLVRGAPIMFIMDCLGHTSPKTTITYFHGFDIETKKRIAPFVSRG